MSEPGWRASRLSTPSPPLPSGRHARTVSVCPMEPIASLCAKLVVSNIDASVCTIDVDTTALADTSADIPEECEADVIHELDQYKQDEDAIFAELAEFNSAFQQELADGGLAAAILRLLPEPETPVFVPPILEKSKRPINHSKKQKAILMEYAQSR